MGAAHSSSTIELLLGADDAYAMPLAVTLFSALETINANRNVRVTIVDGGISRENQRRIESIVGKLPVQCNLVWVAPDSDKLKDLPAGAGEWDYLSRSMYLRLFAPSLVPAAKVIYLDSDMVVQQNLEELWEIDMRTFPLAAVTELGTTFAEGRLRYKDVWKVQGLDPDVSHFNSGLLVLDLELWRREGLSQAVFDNVYANRNHYRYPDQDALNAVFHQNWLELETKWNYQITYEDLKFTPIPARDVAIFHYSTPFKPWSKLTFREKRPYFLAFLQALWRSGWFSKPEYVLFYARLLRSYVAALPARALSRLTRAD